MHIHISKKRNKQKNNNITTTTAHILSWLGIASQPETIFRKKIVLVHFAVRAIIIGFSFFPESLNERLLYHTRLQDFLSQKNPFTESQPDCNRLRVKRHFSLSHWRARRLLQHLRYREVDSIAAITQCSTVNSVTFGGRGWGSSSNKFSPL